MKSVNAVVLATHSPRKSPTMESPIKTSARLDEEEVKNETLRSGVNSRENSARGSVGDGVSKSRDNSAKHSIAFSMNEEENADNGVSGVSLEDLENDGKQDTADAKVNQVIGLVCLTR